jgi:hypothetical protein
VQAMPVCLQLDRTAEVIDEDVSVDEDLSHASIREMEPSPLGRRRMSTPALRLDRVHLRRTDRLRSGSRRPSSCPARERHGRFAPAFRA